MNEKIDNMIDEIVLNFDSDDITNLLISKIADMRGRRNLEVEGNSICFKNSNFMRKVIVDTNSKSIELIEKGKKPNRKDNKRFESTLYYNVINGNGVIIRNNLDVSAQRRANHNEINGEKNLSYTYYKEGKKTSINVEQDIQNVTTDKEGNRISEEKGTVTTINYYLIYGDYIQKKLINGDVKYYYFTKIDEDKMRKIEISKEDFNRLSFYKDDFYEILNDKFFQRVRR